MVPILLTVVTVMAGSPAPAREVDAGPPGMTTEAMAGPVSCEAVRQ